MSHYWRLSLMTAYCLLCLPLSASTDTGAVYHFVWKFNLCTGGAATPFTSLSTAATAIQPAVDAAAAGFAADGKCHIVIVLPGFPAAETPFCSADTNDYEELVTIKDGVILAGVFGPTLRPPALPAAQGPLITYSHDLLDTVLGPAAVLGFNIEGGVADKGGGVFVKHANLYLLNNVISGCMATSFGEGGGGVYVTGSRSAIILGNDIVGNTATFGGGIYVAAESPIDPAVIVGNHFSFNSSTFGGGGIMMKDLIDVVVEANRIEMNTATSGSGGGILVDGGTVGVQIGLNELTSNTAMKGGGIAVAGGGDPIIVLNELTTNFGALAGGGIHVTGSGSSPTIGIDTGADGINFFGNVLLGNFSPLSGGGIAVEAADAPSISSNQFAFNRAGGVPYPGPALPAGAGGLGGAIFWSSAVPSSSGSITANDIHQNLAGSGAGIYMSGASAPISKGRLEKNVASVSGGGIHLSAASPAVSEVRLINNLSLISGGGLAVTGGGGVTVTDCVFRENIADGAGGGLHASGSGTSLTVGVVGAGNLFEANAATEGGAGAVTGAASILARDNTVVHNLGSFLRTAGGFVPVGGGGGLHASGAGTTLTVGVPLGGNLFHGNGAENGGAIVASGGPLVSIKDNLFSLNTADANADGSGLGGAVYAAGDGTELTIGGDDPDDVNSFELNSAGTPWIGGPPDTALPPRFGNGGAIAVEELAITAIIKNTFHGNGVSRNGGCIWFHHLLPSEALVRGSVIEENGCGYKPELELPCLPLQQVEFSQWTCPAPTVCDIVSLSDPTTDSLTPVDAGGDEVSYTPEGEMEQTVTFEWPDAIPFPPDGFIPAAKSTVGSATFDCDPFGLPGMISAADTPVKPATVPADPDFNLITLNGGFLAVQDSSGTAHTNSILRNFAERAGGGVWVGFAGPAEDVEIGIAGGANVIRDNLSNFGGGVAIEESAVSTVHYNLIGDLSDASGANQVARVRDALTPGFPGDIAEAGGGGIWVSESTPDIRFNRIAGNLAGSAVEDFSSHGGGIAALASGGIIKCNWIVSNFANGNGGGIWVHADEATLTADHNTLSENDAIEHGGGIFAAAAVTLTNNLIDHFGCYDSAAVYVTSPGTGGSISGNNVFNNSGRRYGGDLADLTGSNGNLSEPPLFVAPATGNFNLAANSPSASTSGDGCADAAAQGWNPEPGAGDGSFTEKRVPDDFTTITAALTFAASAAPGVRITVAPGTYSTASGETFPLLIPDGVVVVSDGVHPATELPTIATTVIDATGAPAGTQAVRIDDDAGPRTAFGGFTIKANDTAVTADGFAGYLFAHAIFPGLDTDAGNGVLMTNSTAWLEHLTVVPAGAAGAEEAGILATVDAPIVAECRGSDAGPYFSHNLSSITVNLPDGVSPPVGEEIRRDIFMFVNDFYVTPECGGAHVLPCDIRGNKAAGDGPPLFVDAAACDVFLSSAASPAWESNTADGRLIGALPLLLACTPCPELAELIIEQICEQFTSASWTSLETFLAAAELLANDVLGETICDDGNLGAGSDEACHDHILALVQQAIDAQLP